MEGTGESELHISCVIADVKEAHYWTFTQITVPHTDALIKHFLYLLIGVQGQFPAAPAFISLKKEK